MRGISQDCLCLQALVQLGLAVIGQGKPLHPRSKKTIKQTQKTFWGTFVIRLKEVDVNRAPEQTHKALCQLQALTEFNLSA